ncbi:MAG: hypothetical protein ACRBBR_11710 [Cellvibrionaceae bacterium]
MEIKQKYIPKNHKRLVKSSFIDYSDERGKSIIGALFFRVLGAIKSRLSYSSAEKYIRTNFPDVAKSQDVARLDGGLTGQYQWIRLYEIASLVKSLDIKSVCEFGSGGSTAMFSRLNLDKSVTLEQSEKWIKRTRELLPENTNLELLRRDRLVVNYDGEPCTKYDLPDQFFEQSFDLIYIDGPTAVAMTDEERNLPILDDTKKTMPNIDVEMFFDKGVYPKAILVDARRATVRRLCEKYEHKYDVFMRYYYKDKSDRSGEFLYHTVLLLK